MRDFAAVFNIDNFWKHLCFLYLDWNTNVITQSALNLIYGNTFTEVNDCIVVSIF